MVRPLIPEKIEFWTELDDLGNLIEDPWCMGGDFNEISVDQNGSSRINARTFHDWISLFSLIDP